MKEPALQHLPIDDLLPYARNAKRHPPEQIAQIAASIKEFGFNAPVLVDGEQGIIAGHGRVLAARKLGLATVPCVVLTHLSEAQKRAYIIADNRLGDTDLAPWDWEMLQAEIDSLKEENYDYTLTGFTDESLAAAMESALAGLQPEAPADAGKDTEPQIDRAEELRIKWGVETGQLWHLGEHRLLCGDSMKAEDVARVMMGENAEAVITDPPYGISHDLDYTRFTGGIADTRNKTKGVLANDNKPFNPVPFLDYKSAVIWGANCFSDRLPMGTWLVWDKRFKNGTAFLSDAEVAWMKGGHGVYIFELTSQGFVRPERVQHPTQKPVALISWCIEKSKAGATIYEPFSGSGTTIIAAENLGRKCRAIEISSGYVAVALQRWADHTGKTPVRA
jgi:DNA modification methylase